MARVHKNYGNASQLSWNGMNFFNIRDNADRSSKQAEYRQTGEACSMQSILEFEYRVKENH